VVRPLQQGHGGAEAGERLRQLAAERAAADDGQPSRQVGEGEDRIAGEEAELGQAGNVRDRRPGAGGDEGATEAQRGAGGDDRLRPAEGALAEKDVDAEVAQAPGGVTAGDLGADAPHAFHRGREVVAFEARAHAELGGAVRLPDGARRAQEGLRRHRTGVQAVAAQ
jgi:hypothetical protein